MQNPLRWIFASVAALAIAAGASYWIITNAQQPEPVRTIDVTGKPKLVVLVVFDQMRGDYLQKWQPLFGEGGFKRLQSDGAWFTNCHYPYAFTLTAPGHTSLVTGALPAKHGVIANEWYDRAEGDSVASTTPPPEQKKKGGGPYRRKSESIGDLLMRVLMGRVASMSIKERAAVLMAALRANAVYWFSSSSGNFVTSAYYRPDPHSWATKFNKAKMADKWLDKTWDRFDPKIDYVKHSGPDDFLTEGSGYLQGQTFPHKFQLAKTKDAKANKKNFYDAVTCSPMGNELLVSFAKTTIENEKLGQGDTVDLLCISFSSNDLVGHCWGPDSQEVLDVTLRSDALVKDLLGYLDDKVGKGKYYFALSADHGVCPLPEMAVQQGHKGGRVEPDVLTTQAESFLNRKYLAEGKSAPWFIPKGANSWVYFNHATLKEQKLNEPDVEKALADWFSAQPGIEKAYTRTEMIKVAPTTEPTDNMQRVRNSFHPDRSGDVMVVLKPYHLFSSPTLSKNPQKSPTYRTTHGMPHSYDTHVPLLVMGPRIEPGVRDAKVTPQAMASILAEAIGIAAPADAQYPAPAGLFKK